MQSLTRSWLRWRDFPEDRPRLFRLAPYLLSVWSGVAVFAGFEPVRSASMAYVALIPLLLALRMRPDAARRLGYLGGLACWLPSLWFLSPVTLPGAVVLAAYCALYWVPAAALWSGLLKHWTPRKPLLGLRLVLGGAAVWALLEGLRGRLLTGFPWNNLGVSQVDNPALIQLASLGGVEALSFVLVAMNLGLGLTLISLGASLLRRGPRRMHPELYVPILLLVLSFSWGGRELRRVAAAETETLRVAVIQPNIEIKWDVDESDYIRKVLWEQSQLAAMFQPELLIWPETALPDELRVSRESMNLVRDVVELGVPLLLGTLDVVFTEEEDGSFSAKYYNAAMLVDTEGVLRSLYWKRHLVMFGEYIPFANLFPFLRSMTPMPEDVTPGTEPGVKSLPGRNIDMGMLICFEDLMPYLSRDLAAEGARLFVNQTNDAWFDPLWGSRAHLDNAVFRSIEQRRPTVRATNTGVSAWIDAAGRVRQRFQDPVTGSVRLRGFDLFDLEIPLEPETTLFHRYPLGFLFLSAGLSLLLWRGKERGNQPRDSKKTINPKGHPPPDHEVGDPS